MCGYGGKATNEWGAKGSGLVVGKLTVRLDKEVVTTMVNLIG